MMTDSELKADLVGRLHAIPAINAADIEVNVDNGQATLSGNVDTRQTRFQVERTARRVSGLRGLQVNVRHAEAPVRKAHT
jgi:osmotically-inducible protein OsmY